MIRPYAALGMLRFNTSMMIAPEVKDAAQRLLDGDDSATAAAALEEALHIHHPFAEEFEDLLEALALYALALGIPYTDYEQLCEAIRQSIVGGSAERDA